MTLSVSLSESSDSELLLDSGFFFFGFLSFCLPFLGAFSDEELESSDSDEEDFFPGLALVFLLFGLELSGEDDEDDDEELCFFFLALGLLDS